MTPDIRTTTAHVSGVLLPAVVMAVGCTLAPSAAVGFAMFALALTLVCGHAADRLVKKPTTVAEWCMRELPKVHASYDPDWFRALLASDVYSARQERMLFDYLNGRLSSEGWTIFAEREPIMFNRHGVQVKLAWAENPRRYVAHYGGIPLDRWPCAERGHLFDKRLWEATNAISASARFTCYGCKLDFSEQGVYGSELYEAA